MSETGINTDDLMRIIKWGERLRDCGESTSRDDMLLKNLYRFLGN